MVSKGTHLQPIVNMSQGSNEQYSEYRQKDCIIIIKFDKRLEFKLLEPLKRNDNYVR